MKLKASIIFAIRSDKKLRAKMILGLNITQSTLYRWLQIESIMLTTADCLQIIADHLGLNPCDLYEKDEPINKIETPNELASRIGMPPIGHI